MIISCLFFPIFSCVYFYSQGGWEALPWIFHAGLLDDRRDTLHFTYPLEVCCWIIAAPFATNFRVRPIASHHRDGWTDPSFSSVRIINLIKFDFLNNQTSSSYSDPMADENQTILQVRKPTTERTVAEMFELYISSSLVVCSSVHTQTQTIAYSERSSERKRRNGLLIPRGSSRRGHHARLVLSLSL